MVGIMGPSGCGKSTLMHILGLLHAPDDADPPASLVIGGTDVADLSDRERTKMRAERMGFVFQAFNLVPTLTAIENVALPAEYAGRRRSEATKAAAEALDWVGLADRGNHRPTELSGGQQQRVAVARALVTQPDLSAGRRADGQPGLREHERGAGPAAPVQHRASADHPDGHARSARGRGVRPHRRDARRPDHERAGGVGDPLRAGQAARNTGRPTRPRLSDPRHPGEEPAPRLDPGPASGSARHTPRGPGWIPASAGITEGAEP